MAVNLTILRISVRVLVKIRVRDRAKDRVKIVVNVGQFAECLCCL